MALTITILPVGRVMNTRKLITIVRPRCSFSPQETWPQNFILEHVNWCFLFGSKFQLPACLRNTNNVIHVPTLPVVQACYDPQWIQEAPRQSGQ